MTLEGTQVTVVGLGKSGLAAVKLLLLQGAQVLAQDDKPLGDLEGAQALCADPRLTLKMGERLSAAHLAGATLVVVSPGVPSSLPALVEARAAGKTVIGELELAYRALPSTAPWVAITGTNGKSTTTALTGELFRAAGLNPFVGGNLGTPLSEAALAPGPFGAFVIELSSFQLESTDRFHPSAAAVLNLTPDHLDRYESHAAYGRAKARIFLRQTAADVAVVNADDADVTALLGLSSARNYGFSLGPPLIPPRALLGLAVPSEGGFTFDFADRPAFTVTNRALRGGHNLQNAMAAALLAFHQGISPAVIQRGLDSYPGLPHRLESVRTLRGVEWVNDSKATNVDAAAVGLAAFRGGRVWWIAGGKGKGASYAPLKAAGRGIVVGVLTIGEDAAAIERELAPPWPVVSCETLEQAVGVAASQASAGEVVLLSPACASYDQFKNFEERGDTFKRLVLELP